MKIRNWTWREPVYAPIGEFSMTQTQFKDECNINSIMKKYHQGFAITHLNKQVPEWGDFGGVTNMQDALDLVREGETEFMAMNSSVRAAANHDPVQFIEMMGSDEGQQELHAAGLEFGETSVGRWASSALKEAVGAPGISGQGDPGSAPVSDEASDGGTDG